MDYIIEKELFHIQRIPIWQIGTKCEIGLELNNLTKELEKEKPIRADGNINEIEENEIRQKVEYYSSYHMYKRENIFEKVRLELFPEKPSRKNSLWLCDNGENLNYWKQKLNNQGKLFKVKATGKVHKGCAINLSSDGAVLSEINYSKQAIKYWSGLINSEESVEYLFTGMIEVIEESTLWIAG